jgi:hypothetical protein
MTEFRDATRLANWTKLALAGFILLTAWAVVSDLLQIEMLRGFNNGSYPTPAALHDATVANDTRQRITRLTRLAAYVLSGLLILVWIYRANANARALGATGLQFTPAWAVGWFFVPVANLVKPFDAVKEIWRASAHPPAWWRQPAPTSLGWWWFFLLLAIFAGNVAPRLSMRARSLDALIDASWVTVISDLAGIMAGAIFLRTISQVQRMQAAHRAAPPGDAPPGDAPPA